MNNMILNITTAHILHQRLSKFSCQWILP